MEKNMRELQGKGAFITGGASGVGFALARAFGRAKMRVMLADIEVGALNAALAELKGQGIDAHVVECDVADRASVQHAAKETFAALGKVHLICSNAGVGCGGPLELITPGDWDWVIGVNLMGFVHVIQAFLPRLKEQGEGGHIVTTSSVVGFACTPGTGPYNAAKFANVAVAETLAAELAGSPIGVSIIGLGNVQTRITESARNRPERYGAATETSPEATEQLAAFVRMGQPPDEVAEKVMRGIMEDEVFIFTHPEFRNLIEDRFQRILTAYSSPPAS
jgi:NAD(P)-dependent dehydrogenase (short-subunit alcohol dehydrogenase family)